MTLETNNYSIYFRTEIVLYGNGEFFINQKRKDNDRKSSNLPLFKYYETTHNYE